jgi:hypothetical protein
MEQMLERLVAHMKAHAGKDRLSPRKDNSEEDANL